MWVFGARDRQKSEWAPQPNPPSEAQQRQSAVLSTSRERRQRQQSEVDTMVKPTKLAGLTILLQW